MLFLNIIKHYQYSIVLVRAENSENLLLVIIRTEYNVSYCQITFIHSVYYHIPYVYQCVMTNENYYCLNKHIN